MPATAPTPSDLFTTPAPDATAAQVADRVTAAWLGTTEILAV